MTPARSLAGYPGLRVLRAGNASPLTLDGTRTYLVGERRVAVIDPGPPLNAHLDAIVRSVEGAAGVDVLLTHAHPDHAGGAPELGRRLGVRVRRLGSDLSADDVISTDGGDLRVIPTPGHTPDHAAFHWAERGAAFCGDLMLGGLDTALVAPPDGDLGDYLDSLERLRALALSIIFPTHGPPFEDPPRALDRYLAHRARRAEQVLEALSAGPAPTDAVGRAVYGGEVAEELRAITTDTVTAYLEHLARRGAVERDAAGSWRLRGGISDSGV